MEIINRDIEIAEKLLLPNNMSFDEERRNFIKSMESCDLLAVPGSGKTTALEAKLCCLSLHFPLDKYQGVLVLSHTNNAVNEIKKKLRTDCFQLFEPPHFIGTVQDFVDKFLAIPYYELRYGKKVHVIDKAAYEKEVDSYLRINRQSWAVNALLYRNFDFYNISIHTKDDGSKEFRNAEGKLLTFPAIKTWEEEGTVEAKQAEVKDYILKMKKHILQKGVLSYKDCYLLADAYIKKYPFITKTLRGRFKYIFIDETQDLKKFQLDLIDRIFNCKECCLQRIGDKNQTIFERPDRKTPEQWAERNAKTLLNSFRLTPTIAKIVNPFTVDTSADVTGTPLFQVIGKRILENGDIPPYLILFDKTNKDKLLPYFDSLIESLGLRNCEEGKKYGFHIVGWSVKYDDSKEKDKLRLKDIFPNCGKQSDKGLCSYSTLSEFIVFGCKDVSMEECKSVVCKILVYLLRILGKVDDDKRYYSKTRMEAYIREQSEPIYNDYLTIIYQSAISLFQKDFFECYRVLKDYIFHGFSAIFKIGEDNIYLQNFCGDEFDKDLVKSTETGTFSDITIGSVHSVKGQTHCATMYVETSFNGYETEHLIKKRNPTKKNPNNMFPSPLFQEIHQFQGQVTRISTMRMIYVGFSRPTHLLCYAVFKENWTDNMIARMKGLGWKIETLS